MSAEYAATAQAALRGALPGRRRRAWAILAGVGLGKGGAPAASPPAPIAWEARSAVYADQVERDTNRALHRVADDASRTALRARLTRILNALFAAHATWHYFQGFHDLVGVLLLSAHEERGADSDAAVDADVYRLAEALSGTYWSGHLLTGDLSEARAALALLPALVGLLDARLAAFLRAAAPEPIFALPWLLTWFAYNLDGLADAALAFDLCLATHPLAPLYLAAVMIHTQRDAVLQLDSDYAAVHGALSRLPAHLAPTLPALVRRAVALLAEQPPAALLPLHTFPLASPVHRFPFEHHAPLVYPRLPLVRRVRVALRSHQWGVLAVSSVLVALLAVAALRLAPRLHSLAWLRAAA